MSSILMLIQSLYAPAAIFVTIALIVAFLGPQVGIVSPWNWVLALSIVAATLIGYLIWWLIRKRRQKEFEEGLLGQAQADMARASVSRRAEVEALIGRWREAIRLLKESNSKGAGALAGLPWFAIIGEPQSGKSTLLRNSGLDFPIGDAQIHGIGGTKNCDWWFANEAIILDTAGRYAFEVQSAPDREEWTRFLALLKKSRKKKAINGLLVTVPADSLLQKNEDELRIYAQHLRGKINDMMTKLGIVFPVYLVLTKVDLIEGFVGFFSRYPANRVREAVGRTFDNVHPKTSVEGASRTLDDLYDRLCSMSLGLMEEGDPGEPARPYLMFPEEFRNLTGRLKIFVEALLRENIYMRNPVFRGVYITSGTQEGRTIAAAVKEVAGKLGLDLESLTTVHESDQPKRAYFVRDLLSKILIEDAQRDLVRPIKLGARDQFMQALGKVFLPTAAAALLVLIWAFAAFSSNRTAWAGLRDYVTQSRYLGGSAEADEAKITEAIQALADLQVRRGAAVERSAFLNLFMTRSDPSPVLFDRAFTASVDKHVLGPTLARMKSSLEGAPGAPSAYLEDLAAYAAWRRAVQDKTVADPGRLEGLAGPWARPDDRFGVWAKRQDFAALLGAYVGMGGAATGNVSLDTVGRRLQELVSRLQEKDPYVQVRDLARQSEGAVRSRNDSASIQRAWGELKGIIAGGGGALKVPPELFTRLDQDLSALADGQPALPPLRQLAALVAGPGAGAGGSGGAERQAAFAEKVLKPLQEARDLAVPGCPTPDPMDPASVDKVTEALGAFGAEIGKKSDAVKAGVSAFNVDLSPADQIPDQTVADLVRYARLSEAFQQCTQGWFEGDGPFTAGSMYKAAGGASAGGGAPQWVLPPGGAFQCLHPKASGAAVQIDTASLDKTGAAVRKLAGLDGVPSDLGAQIGSQFAGNRGSVGGGGRGGNYTAALGRVELTVSPTGWTLDVVPDQLRSIANDGSLKTALDEIKKGLAEEGKPTSAFRNFPVDVYTNALNEIADKIEAGLGDPSPLAIVAVAQEVFASNTSAFDKAIRAAASAPHANLARQLDSVPKTVWTKLLEKAAVSLDAFYQGQMRDAMAEFSGCYPFSPSGSPCDAGRFTEVFGPDGAVGKLAGFAADSGSGPRTKFGESLPVGPEFQKMLRSAVRVHRAFTASKEAAFDMSFEARPAEILPEGKVKREEILVFIQSSTLTLGGTNTVPYDHRMAAKIPARVPVEEGALSALDVVLGDERERKLGEKLFGGGFTTDKVELGDLPQERGPWSFLKLLERGRSGPGAAECCTWDVVLREKEKKKEKVGTVRVTYQPITPRGGVSILDPGFWRLERPPESVKD